MKTKRKKELKLIKFLKLLFKLLELISFPKHFSKYSKKTFDNWQLFALLVLRQKSRKSYDDFVTEWLPCCTVILDYLKLDRVPSASCLKRFAKRLKAYWAHSLLGKIPELAKLKELIVGMDGTTNSTKYGSRHYYHRIGVKLKKKDSVKWVSVVDLIHQLILVIKIRKKARHDNVDFKPSMRKARKATTIKRGIGDKAFDKEKNYEFFEEEIGEEFIAPVRNKDVPIWRTKGQHRKKLKKILPKNEVPSKKQKRNSNQRNKEKNGRRTLLSQVPHEKNRTPHANHSLQFRQANQARSGNMTKFFTKNGNHHPDDKNKTYRLQKQVYPRQQEDVTGANVYKNFLYSHYLLLIMKWRFLSLETKDAFYNMAVDQAVAEFVSQGKSLPTIRFYKWKPAAVSLSSYQNGSDVDLGLCKSLAIDCVRRVTGGRAVYHDCSDFTYSVAMPVKSLSIDKHYKKVCGWIVKSLKHLRINSELKNKNDIIVSGKKISGNAAKILNNNLFFQHGTLVYDLNVGLTASLLKIKDKSLIKDKVTSILEQVSVDESKVYSALKKGFLENKDYEIGCLSRDELKRVEELVEEYKVLDSKDKTKSRGACYLIWGDN